MTLLGLIEKLWPWVVGRCRDWLDKCIDERIEAWFRTRAQKAAKEAARRTHPQVEAAPQALFDPWSAQPPPMGAIFGVDPEQVKRERLIRAMMGHGNRELPLP